MLKYAAPLAAFALAAGLAHAQTTPPQALTANLKGAAGAAAGTVSLTQAPGGVLLRVEALGLTPGWHGLHLHEKGDCSSADFKSAAGHVHGAAPTVHGLLNPNGNETGDLPNLYVGADGAGRAEILATQVTLGGLRDADGSAVVIHASPDDHLSQPIGGAGARVACAEIH